MATKLERRVAPSDPSMPAEAAAAPPPSWLVRALPVITAYVLSRAITMFGAVMFHLVPKPLHMWRHPLASWDASWYLTIIERGYAKSVPPGQGAQAMSNIAFFPAYPVTVRFVCDVTGLPPVVAGVVVSTICGLAATLLVFLIAERLLGHEAAVRSAVLFAFFPASFVLSMVYAESLFIMAAAGCLYGLLTRRWVLAGLAGAVATAGRPTGLILMVCAAWAAGEAILRRREWRAVVAPILVPAGFLGYFTYLHVHTGSYTSWADTEKRGWDGQSFDFGLTTAKRTWEVLQAPLDDIYLFFSITPLVLAAVGLWLLWRWRPPAVIVIYSVGMLGAIVGAAQLWSTLRYLLAIFPLLIAYGRVLQGSAYVAAVGLSGSLMLYFLVLASLPHAFIP